MNPLIARAIAPNLTQWSRELTLGFLFWLAFLLVLEPGNVLHAMNDGRTLAWDREAMRILVASLLGASSTPLVMALVRRFPIEGRRRWRNVALHAANAMAVAFVLIAVSCVLAAWFEVGDSRLIPVLTANGPLLVFCIAALTGWAHLKPASGSADRTASAYATRIAVKERERQTWVDLKTIDWIEAQGNYVALHAGDRTHLIRDTLANVEKGLDPRHFVRIHRSAIVALDRIEAVGRPTNGDGTITLIGGRELRLSRSYRAKLREQLDRR